MNLTEKKENKKTWITPEIKKITGFDVHENVVATSIVPYDSYKNDSGISQES